MLGSTGVVETLVRILRSRGLSAEGVVLEEPSWSAVEDTARRFKCRVVLVPPGLMACSRAKRLYELEGIVVVEGGFDLEATVEWLESSLESLEPCSKPVYRVKLVEPRECVKLPCGACLPQRGPPFLVAAEVYVERGLEALSEAAEYAHIVVLGFGYGVSASEARSVLRRARSLAECVGVDAPPHILEALADEADVVLSVTPSTRRLLSRLPSGTPVVVTPYSLGERPGGAEERISRLARLVGEARGHGLEPIADPLLSPPCLGLLESLAAYREASRVLQAPLMAGLGNVYELIDADVTGVAALLTSLLGEAGVSMLLVTAESYKSRTALLDVTVAAAIATHACSRGIPPKDLEVNLLDARCKRPGRIPCEPWRGITSIPEDAEPWETIATAAYSIIGRCCGPREALEQLEKRRRVARAYKRLLLPRVR